MTILHRGVADIDGTTNHHIVVLHHVVIIVLHFRILLDREWGLNTHEDIVGLRFAGDHGEAVMLDIGCVESVRHVLSVQPRGL